MNFQSMMLYNKIRSMPYTEVQQVTKPQVSTFDSQYVFAAEAIVPANVVSMELAVHCGEMHICNMIILQEILKLHV